MQESSRTISKTFVGCIIHLWYYLEWTEEKNPQVRVVRGAGVHLRQGVMHISLHHLIQRITALLHLMKMLCCTILNLFILLDNKDLSTVIWKYIEFLLTWNTCGLPVGGSNNYSGLLQKTVFHTSSALCYNTRVIVIRQKRKVKSKKNMELGSWQKRLILYLFCTFWVVYMST